MLNTIGLLITAGLLASAALHAQTTGTLTGKVLDENGKPAAGASVKVLNTQPVKGAVVKSDGTYLIAGVPAGEYDIVAQGVGVKVTRRVRISIGQETREDFRLTNVVSVCDLPSRRKPYVDIGTSTTIHTSSSDQLLRRGMRTIYGSGQD